MDVDLLGGDVAAPPPGLAAPFLQVQPAGASALPPAPDAAAIRAQADAAIDEAHAAQRNAAAAADLDALEKGSTHAIVYISAPVHLCDDDSAAGTFLRANLVKFLLKKSQIQRNMLVNISIASLMQARAVPVALHGPKSADARPAPAMMPLISLAFADRASADKFIGPKTPLAPKGVGFFTIREDGLGLEMGATLWTAHAQQVNDIPTLPHALVEAQGTIVRCFLSRPKPHLLDPAHRETVKNSTGLLLQSFWSAADQVPLVQMRTNFVAPQGCSIQSASDYLPCGLYFDVDMLQIPPLFPSDLPSGLGPCRWMVNSTLNVRPFAGGPISQQPHSRLQRQMLNYFGGDEGAAGMPDMPKGRRGRKAKAASAKRSEQEDGEISDEGWTRVQRQKVQPRWQPPQPARVDRAEMSRRAQKWV